MAVETVEIVNPNGRKGRVAATYQPLVDGAFKVPPSRRDPRGEPAPAADASPVSAWQSDAASQGLPGDEAEAEITRDEPVASINDSKEE